MNSHNPKKIVIVGAGISGLTAGAYMLRSAQEVLILEKSANYGGLVSSFTKDGFLFDTGPRAIGNAGIVRPMLQDLDIDLPCIKGEVSTGIEHEIIHFDSNQNIDDFIISLHKLFPACDNEIRKIKKYIRTYTGLAKILNKVENPFFKNTLKDMPYLFLKLIPWLPSFLWVILKTTFLTKSVETVLTSISSNQSLNDMVCQHFFKGTPAHFALGYFENFQDYIYPLGGTGQLPHCLAQKIISHGGKIQTNTEIIKIDSVKKKLTDQHGKIYSYDALLWAADLKSLYRTIFYENCSLQVRRSIKNEEQKFLSAKTGESVFTIFVAVNEIPEFFKKLSRGHFIYTPHSHGLGNIHRTQLEYLKTNFTQLTKEEFFHWLKEFCYYNSYEISIPILKDPSTAPHNKTGLIISLLFDGELFEMVKEANWYNELKEKTIFYMLQTLEDSIYPDLTKKILFKESATPVTLMTMFNNTNGAITGWSLEEKAPVANRLTQIMSTAKTKIPDVFKSGQWTYSPSGVPIAILTGRIAAKAIQKKLARL